MARVRIHRFGNKGALAVLDKGTQYMSPAKLRELSDALLACADDIDHNAFRASEFGSVAIEFDGEKE